VTIAFPPLASGRLSSPYGPRERHGVWRHHNGLDISAPEGTEITAVLPGVVVASTENGAPHFGGYGHTVMIEHPAIEGLTSRSWITLYAHQLRQPPVSEGQQVSAGQLIGWVDSTNGRNGEATRFQRGSGSGPHLHFEVKSSARRVGGRAIPGNPGENNVDPRPWLSSLGIVFDSHGRFQRLETAQPSPESAQLAGQRSVVLTAEILAIAERVRSNRSVDSRPSRGPAIAIGVAAVALVGIAAVGHR